ncbi:Cardiolipin synthase B [Aquicella siphonis]|uniref:Cardiolipin synthase B n=1 Tax=Aquicella siphonis TaxID=254247 RepID=A0A5E4PD03_9COXI|nr:phosphatidylserine/phosphatidylglycerophosphate/cardiolipin synthase family protein [Aquicella siphonis]VVC74769.1 Cardiolipin synthase B [Aquicella siphonis]
MDPRSSGKRLKRINTKLASTEDKSLYGQMSSLHFLEHAPVPLSTMEMHSASGDLILGAKHEVLMMFYKFSSDSDGGREILNALTALKSRAESEKTPVRVCMIVNSRGKLAEALYGYNQPLGLEKLGGSEFFHLKVTYHPTSAFGTLHSKLILVDSTFAMIRGGDPHSGNDRDRHQFETATLIQGPLVAIMRQDFCDVWNAYNIDPLHVSPAPATLTDKRDSTASSIPCLFLSKRENGNPFYYGSCAAPYKIAFLQAIEDAVTCIDIMTSNINDPDICAALAKACNRGIFVNILTGKDLNDSKEYWWGGTNLYALASIVRQVDTAHLPFLSIRWATNDQNNLVHHGEKFTLHAKYACIDKLVVFAGSSPLDKQAMYYSREADIIFEDADAAAQFDLKFFRPCHAAFRDYFDDAYFILFNAIELESKRISQSADTDLKREKAERLREMLAALSQVTRPPRDKLLFLLDAAGPLLEIRTGNKPGMPYSYNTVMNMIYKYGLEHHLSAAPLMVVPEVEKQKHGFFTPPALHRSKSMGSLHTQTEDKGESLKLNSSM